LSRKLVSNCSQYRNAKPTRKSAPTRFTRRSKVSLRRMAPITLAMVKSNCRILTSAVFQIGGLASASKASKTSKEVWICEVSFSRSCSSRSKSPRSDTSKAFHTGGFGSIGAIGSLRASLSFWLDRSGFELLISENDVSPDEEHELLIVLMPGAGSAPAPKAASSSSSSSSSWSSPLL
jgi:hypothetical protein